MALAVRNPPASAGDIRDLGSIPESGRSLGGGHGNPLQYSCLENSWTEEPGRLQSMGSHKTEATEHAACIDHLYRTGQVTHGLYVCLSANHVLI